MAFDSQQNLLIKRYHRIQKIAIPNLKNPSVKLISTMHRTSPTCAPAMALLKQKHPAPPVREAGFLVCQELILLKKQRCGSIDCSFVRRDLNSLPLGSPFGRAGGEAD